MIGIHTTAVRRFVRIVIAVRIAVTDLHNWNAGLRRVTFKLTICALEFSCKTHHELKVTIFVNNINYI